MGLTGVADLGEAFRGRRVLITGHTGFKGSWLALWLQRCGAEVYGLALAPESEPNHWQLLDLQMSSFEQDIRDAEAVSRIVAQVRPDFVFHLAAQAYVRRSYADPLANWQTNVMGTANVLEACRHQPQLRGIVVVTTDKCYRNNEWHWGYRESDHLGGHDPYSASKAATELLVSSYRDAFFSGGADRPLVATARAGNVIGGGDWSEDRLLPDAFRALAEGQALEIRSPQATRPWQHVLDALAGYLLLAERLLAGDESCARAWNFGPDSEANKSVAEVLNVLQGDFPELQWNVGESDSHEATLLYLDSSAARAALGWRPRWGFDATMTRVAAWYRAWYSGGNVVSLDQLEAYQNSVV